MVRRLIGIDTAEPVGQQLPLDVRSEILEFSGDLTATVKDAVDEAVPDAVSTALVSEIPPAVSSYLQENLDPGIENGDTPGTIRVTVAGIESNEFPASATTAAAITDSGAAGRAVLTSVDGQEARNVISAASRSYLARNARDAGIDVSGLVDESAKINAYLLDALNNQREAYFPRGDYLMEQIVYPSGLKMAGPGIGGFGATAAQAGARFRQTLGANKPLIVFSGNLVSGYLQIGPVDIGHIMFMGRPENISGSAIAFQGADGTLGAIQDTTVIHHCLFRYWPEHGIESRYGARPFHVSDANFLWNGGAGIYLEQNIANMYQAMCFDNISGDGNPLGLLRCKGLDSHASLTLIAPKSERRVNPITSVAGQFDTLVFENCDNAKINVIGGTHISSVPAGANHEPPGAFFVVKGTGKPQIHWTGLDVRVRDTDVAGTPAMLRDEQLSHQVPIATSEGFYGGTDGQYRWAQSLLAGREDELLSGESTIDRTDSGVVNTTAISSELMRFSFFTAQKTELVTKIQIPCGNSPYQPGTPPTLIKAGLYRVNDNGDLSRVGESAHTPAAFATANTENVFALTEPAQKIRGRRYAVGVLIKSAGTMPTLYGSTGLMPGTLAKSPMIAAARGTQTDLPVSVTAAQLASSSTSIRFYAEVLP